MQKMASRKALVGLINHATKAVAANKGIVGTKSNPYYHHNLHHNAFSGRIGSIYNLNQKHFCTNVSPSLSHNTKDRKGGADNTNDNDKITREGADGNNNDICKNRRRGGGFPLSNDETRLLLKHIKVDDFKKKLVNIGTQNRKGGDYIALHDAINLCKETGAAITDSEAEEVIKKLDDAGVILIFRKRIFLEPQRVAEILSKAIPLQLTHDDEDDPRKQELVRLEKEKAEIDRIAQKQVRNTLWMALGGFTAQSALFFRLTFWDLSWDVMEPITFFVTSSSLLVGFFFFVITNRDPSYRDLMRTLLSSKQKKLMKKRNFDLERLKELQMQHCLPQYENVSHSFPSF